MPRPRVPVNFLVLPVIFCGMFSIIAAGVAHSQGPNADWRVFGWLLGGLAACGLIYVVAPVEWISDKELTDMEAADRAAAMEKEVEALVEAARDGSIEGIYRVRRWKHYAFTALVVVFMFHEYFIGSVKMADGAKGMGIAGLTLGSWRLLGHTWTGFELLFMGGCLWYLWITVRAGVSLLVRAQKRPG